MHFHDFLRRLPAMERPVTIAVPQGDALEDRPVPIDGYVAPTVAQVDWPDSATVVLVEAAGAVGKSAAASAIASELNWPLVRAEKAQVGSYSLSGLIQDATGFNSTFIAEVADGKSGIVVDSLDEAHFRAGTENFLAFIDNIWRVSGYSGDVGRRSPSIVMLSRFDTAELARQALEVAGVPVATVRLEFFDRDGANRFIEAYMVQRFKETKRGEYNLPLGSPRPFAKLRDNRMQQIASVIQRRPAVNLNQDWDLTEDFLGYAPVLIALAEALAVSNPSAEDPSLDASDQSNLLREIIDHISVREQVKFSQHLQPKLQALLPAAIDRQILAESMYQPIEQCARILGFVGGIDLRGTLPVLLPEAARPAYDEAVRTFLPDHPFIKGRSFASIIFADYLMAQGCQSLEVRAALEVDPKQLVVNVGPFFARFLSNYLGDSTVGVEESLVHAIISSFNQEADLLRASESEVLVSLHGEVGRVLCSRESTVEQNEPDDLEFIVENVSGGFVLDQSAKRLSVVTDGGVILGETGKHLSMGPRVVIVAEEIVLEAETLRVDTEHGSKAGLFLASDDITANYLNRVQAGDADLHVFSMNPPPRLRAYRRTLKLGEVTVPYQRYLDLRTILTSFRASTKGGPAVLVAKLDNKIVRGNAHREAMLTRLREIGAITISGSLYHLDLDILGGMGFGIQDLRTGEPPEAVLRLVHDCRVK